MIGARGAADEQALRQTQNGQLLGRKGRETRQRIIAERSISAAAEIVARTMMTRSADRPR